MYLFFYFLCVTKKQTMIESIILAIVAFLLLRFLFSTKKKKQTSYISIELSENWRETLEEKVPFYKKLLTRDRYEFDKRVVSFLESVKITGVNCKVEELDQLLIASSSIIPVFQFSKCSRMR